MRLISQSGQLDGSTGRDNRQIHLPLRASEHYRAADVPGKMGQAVSAKRRAGYSRSIKYLWKLVGKA
jgi:hypothetical protein